jgi:putative endonuclease
MYVAHRSLVAQQKRFVYVIRSLSNRDRYYTGVTYDVGSRLCSHNAGECVHTTRHRPWELDVVIAFRQEARALEFERYLKSSSGSLFAQRHLR